MSADNKTTGGCRQLVSSGGCLTHNLSDELLYTFDKRRKRSNAHFELQYGEDDLHLIDLNTPTEMYAI